MYILFKNLMLINNGERVCDKQVPAGKEIETVDHSLSGFLKRDVFFIVWCT